MTGVLALAHGQMSPQATEHRESMWYSKYRHGPAIGAIMNHKIQKSTSVLPLLSCQKQKQCIGHDPCHSITSSWADHLSQPWGPLSGSAPTLTPLKEPGRTGQAGNLCFVLAPSCSSLSASKAPPQFLLWPLIHSTDGSVQGRSLVTK